ncbi:hypothetical protein PN466_07345 [Roseofilum reptotaenium CS-1145]|uniref:Uncharacterized protein n=1 Tax=Roseofilum reptotaenium AO1-A TaxID=1925591 RepID=A0A1L9QMC7_9CYAN|nr:MULTISPECIES: hypothetical protein [Roseofilum]MBP0027016.1 hypothetical protein [Roseofilum sp. Guam]MDB9516759.1 hypothetical protein [Roseofilum reptotaenium CS-1145]OJJ21972.1 hypothetical protein BI308_20020 [Roseofilum reptotaenium AO1-A]
MSVHEYHPLNVHLKNHSGSRSEMVLAIIFGSFVLGFIPIALFSDLSVTTTLIPTEAQLWSSLAEKQTPISLHMPSTERMIPTEAQLWSSLGEKY